MFHLANFAEDLILEGSLWLPQRDEEGVMLYRSFLQQKQVVQNIKRLLLIKEKTDISS